MSESNARLNVLISLKSAIEGGERALDWVTKYGAAIATTAATMAVFAAKQSLDLGGRITDLSNQAQIGTDAFQTLSAVGLESGVAMEEISKSAIKLRKNLQDATAGNQAMVLALNQLGLSAAGLQALAPERQWELISEKLATATNRQEALNAVTELFGSKNAPKLMEVLQRLGTDGYDKLAQETAKLRLSPEQLKTLDDAGDKLARIWEQMKFIAAKGTIKVIDSPSVSGEASLISQSFNDNEIERAKALIDIWEKKGNKAMADSWRASLAALQAQAASDPYAERNAKAKIVAPKVNVAQQKAMSDAEAAAFDKKNADEQIKNIGKVANEQLKMQLSVEDAYRKQLQYSSASEKAETQRLAQLTAEQTLSRSLAASKQAMATIETSKVITNTEKDRLRIQVLGQQNEEIQKRIDLLKAENEADANPVSREIRSGKIDNLQSQQGTNSVDMVNSQAKSIGTGATQGAVEYLNSVPDAASRASIAVMAVAQGMENGIGSSLEGLIRRTMTWGQALANIGTSIVNEVIAAFARMAAQWITQQIVMAIAGDAIQAAQIAALAPMAMASALMWSPAATAASIATYGGAAITGAAMANSMIWASAIGLAEGGPVSGAGTGKSDSIPTWLSNGEYVMPADMTAQYRPLLDSMRAGTLNPGQLAAAPGSGGGSATQLGGSTNIAIHAHYDQQAAVMAASRTSEFENVIVDMVARNFHRISGTG